MYFFTTDLQKTIQVNKILINCSTIIQKTSLTDLHKFFLIFCLDFELYFESPQKLMFIDRNWSAINSKGQVQFINEPVFDLAIEKEDVLDSYFDQKSLFILTKTSIYIFDSSIF